MLKTLIPRRRSQSVLLEVMESTSVSPSPDNTHSGQLHQQSTSTNNVLQQNQQPSQSLPSSPAYLLPTAASSTTTLSTIQQQQQPSMERLSRPMAFDKVNIRFFLEMDKALHPIEFIFFADGNSG